MIEKCIYWQLSEHLERNKLLSSSQYGFRQGRSTVPVVTYLTDYIRQNADNGNCTGVLYIDLKKAFYSVYHAGLLHKLRFYGIKCKELDWFSNYLFNRRQCAEYDGCKSDMYHVVNCVPQGSILGPLLFIVLMDDMPTMVKKCKILKKSCMLMILCCFIKIRIVRLFKMCLSMKLTELISTCFMDKRKQSCFELNPLVIKIFFFC